VLAALRNQFGGHAVVSAPAPPAREDAGAKKNGRAKTPAKAAGKQAKAARARG